MKAIQLFTKAIILTFLFGIGIGYETQAQTKQLWGMTGLCGQYGGGTIFKTDSSGNNQTVEHNFVVQNEGGYPQYSQLTQASDGKLYGMTMVGGVYGMGVLFQYDPATATYTKKIDFEGFTNGQNPFGSLIQASDGKLYGMTSNGGVNNLGVLFQYDPVTSTLIKKFDFDGATNGQYPKGSLTQASDGKLYGMTYQGGANNKGVLFQFDPVPSILTKKFDFAGSTNGAYPYGSLMQASDGKLYGMTKGGGVNGVGVLFQYDPTTSAYSKKIDFSLSTNGGSPYGSLIQANDGKLYGLAYQGGAGGGAGVLFQFDPSSSSYVIKVPFSGSTNGGYPQGSLMQASDGKLYGMTAQGGTNNSGVLFQYNPVTSTYLKQYDFSLPNGGSPYGSLIQASNGKLYGMTQTGNGNLSDRGVLFQYDPITSTYTKKLDFFVATNGAGTNGSLMQASNGKLYGMTYYGGSHGNGVLFQYDPSTSIYAKKFDFANDSNGMGPTANLMQASDGKLYGMTDRGGTNSLGVLFQYDPITSIYIKKLDFTNITDGIKPIGSLMQASDGKLYGMTTFGGTNNTGVLFQFDPITSTYIKKIDFNGATNGSGPTGNLMQASDGKLYGMTYTGGSNNMGVLFQYDPVNSSYTKKLDFAGATNGSVPNGSLMQANDGKIYGLTSSGGANNMGVLYQYDPVTSTFTKKIDFAGTTNGNVPNGYLMQASDGKLYGMTGQGGTNNLGVLFQYDPATSTYAKKLDFACTNGSYPTRNLIEINAAPVGINSLEKDVALKLYPNPAHDLLTLELLSGNQKYATVVIENMFGQVIYETQINKSIHQINTAHYTRGIYLVKVNTNDGTTTKKILIE